MAVRGGARRRTRRRIPIIVLVAALTLVVAGVAAAYWGSAGGGSASATTDSSLALTLSPASPVAQLFPGGTTAVLLSIANPNPGSIRVGSLALDTSQGTNGLGVDGAHSACAVSALSFVTQTNAGAGWTIPGNGSLPVTLVGALSMSTAAANTCQGATFTVYLKASP
jgi:hypothetical protein